MSYLNPRASRSEVVIGALIYLMSSYRRTPCERIALYIAGHLECLSRHPGADPIIREICAGMVDEWRQAARGMAPPAAPQHPPTAFKLH